MTRNRFATALLALALPALAAAAPPEIHLAGHRFDPLAGPTAIPVGLSAAPGGSLHLVQLRGPVTGADRELLSRAGTILGYVPEFAFLVRGRAAAIAALADSPRVRWTGPWHPAYKISPAIGTLPSIDPRRQAEGTHRLLVWTSEGRTVTRAADAEIPALAARDDVIWIEEVPEFRTWNDTTNQVIQAAAPGGTSIWARGLHGEGQVAMIMDTGLDTASCYFRDPNTAPGLSHRKVLLYQNAGGNGFDGCDNGHGTHVAGTLAGDQSFVTPGGPTSGNGVAWAAKLGIQDVGDDDVFSCALGLLAVPNDLTASLNLAALGAHVHSNSWGSSANQYTSHAADVDDSAWRNPSMLLVFANGNSGSAAGTVGSPATAKNCVSVGATRQAPEHETVASYSSRGPTADGRVKPTVVAPGGENTAIYSANNHPGNPPAETCAVQGPPFVGTSMATPAVAGAALLIRQYFTEGYFPTGVPEPSNALSPAAALLKAMLIVSAHDMGTPDVPNIHEGWGRVLLEDALYFAGDSRELAALYDAGGLATGESRSFQVTVEAGEPFKVVLVWSDFPATLGTGVQLVNDLDLVVSGPTGSVRGNVFAGGQSIGGGTADRRNVEEVVLALDPVPGRYTVRVSGFNVPAGRQPFALVGTGAFGNWPPAGPAERPGGGFPSPR